MIPFVVQRPAPDSIRHALKQVFAAREYGWQERFDPWSWVKEQFARFSDWLDALRLAHPAAYLAILLVLVALFLLIAVHLAWLVRNAMRAAVVRSGVEAGLRTTHDVAWHLAEARRLSAQGRFREALAERFTALALELDEREVVRFHPSKTPGEYVREARLADADRGALRDLVRDLYRYLFGGVTPTDETWTAFDAEALRLGAMRATA